MEHTQKVYSYRLNIQIAKVLITELIRSKQNYIIADDFNMLQNQETSKYPSLN